MWYIVTSFQNTFSGYLTLLKAITSQHSGFKDSSLLPSSILHVWVYSMLLMAGAFLSGSFWRHSSVLHSCLGSCPDVLHRCVTSSLHAFTYIPPYRAIFSSGQSPEDGHKPRQIVYSRELLSSVTSAWLTSPRIQNAVVWDRDMVIWDRNFGVFPGKAWAWHCQSVRTTLLVFTSHWCDPLELLSLQRHGLSHRAFSKDPWGCTVRSLSIQRGWAGVILP